MTKKKLNFDPQKTHTLKTSGSKMYKVHKTFFWVQNNPEVWDETTQVSAEKLTPKKAGPIFDQNLVIFDPAVLRVEQFVLLPSITLKIGDIKKKPNTSWWTQNFKSKKIVKHSLKILTWKFFMLINRLIA